MQQLCQCLSAVVSGGLFALDPFSRSQIFHRHASASFLPRIWSYHLLHYLFEPHSLEPNEASTQHTRRLQCHYTACLPRLANYGFYGAGGGGGVVEP